jgi:hypothetical protein
VRGETLSRKRRREARNGETARGERKRRRGQPVPAASRWEVAAVLVVVVPVGGTGEWWERSGERENSVERFRLNLGSLIFNRWIWKNN